MKFLKNFVKEEDGNVVVELVVVIGILLSVALIFKDRITEFAKGLMDKLFKWD